MEIRLPLSLNPIDYYSTQNWALVNPMYLVIIHSLLNGNTGNSGEFLKKLATSKKSIFINYSIMIMNKYAINMQSINLSNIKIVSVMINFSVTSNVQ